MLRLVYHTRKCIDEVIQTPQISILSIALYPWSPVVHREFWWQGCSLSKVDHPDTSPAGPVMYKQQGTAHNLQADSCKKKDPIQELSAILGYKTKQDFSTDF